MAHTVVWKHEEDGNTRVLVGHPGAYGGDPEDALDQARKIAAHLQGVDLEPLSVVETDSDVDDDIYACEEVYLGPEDDDELFYDISGMGRWARQKWWPL